MNALLVATENESADGNLDVSPIDTVIESVDTMVRSVFDVLPTILVALVVFAMFLLIGRIVRKRVEPRLTAAQTKSFGKVAATLIYVAILVAGLFVALPIAFPTVNALTILSGLGLVGVAAGFAFQDILSNLLAGVLLILRQPFRAGDIIEVNGYKGEVELITIRETRIRSFTGRRIYIPNKDVYINAIEVQTAFDRVRTDVAIGVGYDTDLSEARALALDAIRGLQGVLDDPAPQAFFTEFGASSMNFDLRYWTKPQQGNIRATQDRVVEAIYDAFNAAGIDLPFSVVSLDTMPSFDRAMGRGIEGNGSGNGRASDLSDLSRAELYELAQERDVPGRSSMSKSELLSALR